MKYLDKDMLMYIGLGVATVVVIILIRNGFSEQTRLIEGLDNADGDFAQNIGDFSKKIKKKTESLKDTLLITKYRKEYEDLIINLEDYCNVTSLDIAASVANDTSKGVGLSKNKEIMELIKNQNAISEYRNSLNETMKYLDSQ